MNILQNLSNFFTCGHANIPFNTQKLVVILALIIALCSFATRFAPYNEIEQKTMIFDERYYIPLAENYITNTYFFMIYPPFGRYLHTAGILLFNPDAPKKLQPENASFFKEKYDSGLNLQGARFMPALLGSFIPLLIYMILLQLFFITQKKLEPYTIISAFVTAIAIAFENTAIFDARHAFMTSFLVFFMLLTVLFAFLYSTKKKSNALFVAVCMCFASAVAIKWFALSLLPFLAYIFYIKTDSHNVLKKIIVTLKNVIILLLITASVYIFWFIPHFYNMKHYYASPKAFEGNSKILLDQILHFELKETYKMNFFNKLAQQFKLTQDAQQMMEKRDDSSSSWYMWPFMYKPFAIGTFGNVSLENGKTVKMYNYIAYMGNPIVWVLSFLGVLFGAWTTLQYVLKKGARADHLAIVIFILYLCNLLPFAFITNKMYLYHYAPALVFGLLLFTLALYKFMDSILQKKQIGYFFVAMITLIIMLNFYVNMPFTYATNVSEDWVEGVGNLPNIQLE
jgi:dolichyl-phosphate-mannose-protein mannosyltransferase